MSETSVTHAVTFHIGDHRVVCSCGAYFETPAGGPLYMPKSALRLWAEHQAQEL